jgi:glycosyltransferase involved in cell wall biosynthesis
VAKNNLKISVILRSKNEERWVGHCIQSILDNFTNPEIINIDNQSTDDTAQIIKNFRKDKNLISDDPRYTKIIFENIKNYTPGRAINLGVKKATNKIILIISAHCVIEKINFTRISEELDKYVCVYGNQIPVYKGKKINKRYLWSNFKKTSLVNPFCKQENRYFLHNAFAFYKKNTLIKYPFDENLAGKEDRFWATNVINNKLNIYYDSQQSVFHHYTMNGATWKGLG